MLEEYAGASARLLQASSDIRASLHHVSREILDSLSSFLAIISHSIKVNKQPDGFTVSYLSVLI